MYHTTTEWLTPPEEVSQPQPPPPSGEAPLIANSSPLVPAADDIAALDLGSFTCDFNYYCQHQLSPGDYDVWRPRQHQGTTPDCQLNMNLTQQINRLRGPMSCGEESQQRETHATIVRAVGGALHSIEECSTVLRLLLDAEQGQHNATITAVQDLVLPTLLALATQLSLARCHVHILELFDTPLRALLEHHGHGPADAVALPSMLTGFLVTQSVLQLDILVLTVRHQFRVMERLLGLPAILWVSEDRQGVEARAVGGGLEPLRGLRGGPLYQAVNQLPA
ncbi:hypothetical protein PspLS_09808 [Pyricularia sp. CBS 133598]|nr:hypothetical protein PspLS_09808 [Pyricularia sp. CBS 133598]